jgi:hypothetical protein
MSNLIGQTLGRYHILEQLGARVDLTCLTRAVMSQIACVDAGYHSSDCRGDMSGLFFGG